jgi:hypothetical protein
VSNNDLRNALDAARTLSAHGYESEAEYIRSVVDDELRDGADAMPAPLIPFGAFLNSFTLYI